MLRAFLEPIRPREATTDHMIHLWILRPHLQALEARLLCLRRIVLHQQRQHRAIRPRLWMMRMHRHHPVQRLLRLVKLLRADQHRRLQAKRVRVVRIVRQHLIQRLRALLPVARFISPRQAHAQLDLVRMLRQPRAELIRSPRIILLLQSQFPERQIHIDQRLVLLLRRIKELRDDLLRIRANGDRRPAQHHHVLRRPLGRRKLSRSFIHFAQCILRLCFLADAQSQVVKRHPGLQIIWVLLDQITCHIHRLVTLPHGKESPHPQQSPLGGVLAPGHGHLAQPRTGLVVTRLQQLPHRRQIALIKSRPERRILRPANRHQTGPSQNTEPSPPTQSEEGAKAGCRGDGHKPIVSTQPLEHSSCRLTGKFTGCVPAFPKEHPPSSGP